LEAVTARIFHLLVARGSSGRREVEQRPEWFDRSEVARILGPTATDLTGATDLPTLTGLLDRSVLAVSNDSGVMHLAAALGKPTVAVFGSTSPVWSGAGAPWVRALYAAYPCSPCFRRTCPIGYGCLRSIDPARAIGAAEELLEADR